MKTAELVRIFARARELLSRPGNDFAWSAWLDEDAALSEIDEIIRKLEAGQLPDRLDMAVLFAPTGPIQEVSLSSGWAQAFLDLSEAFDAELERLHS